MKKNLAKTPDEGDSSDSSGENHFKWKTLENKVSRLESRINVLEIYKLRSEKYRAMQGVKRKEYQMRRQNRPDGGDQDESTFKRPRTESSIPSNPDMY